MAMEYQKRHLLHSDIESVEDEFETFALESSIIQGTWLRQYSATFLWTYFIILHTILLSLLGFVFFGTKVHCENDAYSPATQSIHYVTTLERSNGSVIHSSFTGYPNDVNTRAWEDLVAPLAFNATEQELISSGSPVEDSVKVVSGGYLASLGVYHELHCLRRMRLWLYREVYFPNSTIDDEHFMQAHIGHCIEILRLSTICNADLGLYSFYWDRPNAVKPRSRSFSPRKCVDWESFERWSQERMIDPNSELS